MAWVLFDLGFHVLAGPLIVAWVARWFGGNAHPSDLRQAAVWGYVPFSVAVFLWVPELMLSGPLAASTDAPAHVLQVPILLGVLTATVWAVALWVITSAEVLRFPIWKAVVTMALASVPAFALFAVR